MVTEGNKSSLSSRFFALRGRAAELSVGLTVIYIGNTLFDYLLYPYIIYKLGILKGGVVMTSLSFAACILMMRFYDWSKRDWLGIEAIKSLKVYEGSKRTGRLISWFLKKSDAAAFLFLSIRFDPFITTAYMRHSKFNGMNRRDRTIFMSSLVLANAYWTLAVYMGITLVEWGWKVIRTL